MNRYQIKTYSKSLWMGLMTLAFCACGPKQHTLQNQDLHSESDPFETACNQLDLNTSYAQLWEKDDNNHILLRFSQNPLADDDTPIHITKWSDEDLSRSTLVDLRVRVWVNGIECLLTAGYEDGTLTKERIDYLKTRMGAPFPNGCGMSTTGNFFSKIEFLIKDLDDSWKGLSVYRGTSSATAKMETEGLLPPFYLQFSKYSQERPASLHRFHPLYLQADKSNEELRSLEASYCSLFPDF